MVDRLVERVDGIADVAHDGIQAGPLAHLGGRVLCKGLAPLNIVVNHALDNRIDLERNVGGLERNI